MNTFIGLGVIITLLSVLCIIFLISNFIRSIGKCYVYRCLDCNEILLTSHKNNEVGVVVCKCGWTDYKMFCSVNKERVKP